MMKEKSVKMLVLKDGCHFR